MRRTIKNSNKIAWEAEEYCTYVNAQLSHNFEAGVWHVVLDAEGSLGLNPARCRELAEWLMQAADKIEAKK